ncbi:MAG: hypothetical protein EOO30_06900 [Comamonadaceae bacterium]|nr:MAG: hypothetical protein EOO30_06900 [Comamonadaceae bacterium]
MALAALLFAVQAQAQWGGVLDPEIMRQAGEAATGNIDLGNVEMDTVRIGPDAGRAPTAAEIAAEMRRQEQQQKDEAAWRRRQETQSRVRAGIQEAYQADFDR